MPGPFTLVDFPESVRFQIRNIPAMLRAFADAIDAGEMNPDVATIVFSGPRDLEVDTRYLGREASRFEIAGMLTQAASRTLGTDHE